MKQYSISLLFSLCLGTSIAAYADTSICQGSDYPGAKKVAQCIYLTGLNKIEGRRWIKAVFKTSNITYNKTVCIGTIEQSYTLLEKYLPITKSISFSGDISICPDASGNNCKPLRHTSITCVAKGPGDQGSCTPDTVSIDISAFKNDAYYQACTGPIMPNVLLSMS